MDEIFNTADYFDSNTGEGVEEFALGLDPVELESIYILRI
jgi:hypothetical protein